jgi:hypothetical protein
MPTATGLLALLFIVSLAGLFLPAGTMSMGAGVMLYTVSSIAAIAIWSSKQWPSAPTEALGMAMVGAVVTALFYAMDVFFGMLFHPSLAGLEAAMSVGWGFFFTVIAAFVSVISLAGCARNAVAVRGEPREA